MRINILIPLPDGRLKIDRRLAIFRLRQFNLPTRYIVIPPVGTRRNRLVINPKSPVQIPRRHQCSTPFPVHRNFGIKLHRPLKVDDRLRVPPQCLGCNSRNPQHRRPRRFKSKFRPRRAHQRHRPFLFLIRLVALRKINLPQSLKITAKFQPLPTRNPQLHKNRIPHRRRLQPPRRKIVFQHRILPLPRRLQRKCLPPVRLGIQRILLHRLRKSLRPLYLVTPRIQHFRLRHITLRRTIRNFDHVIDAHRRRFHILIGNVSIHLMHQHRQHPAQPLWVRNDSIRHHARRTPEIMAARLTILKRLIRPPIIVYQFNPVRLDQPFIPLRRLTLPDVLLNIRPLQTGRRFTLQHAGPAIVPRKSHRQHRRRDPKIPHRPRRRHLHRNQQFFIRLHRKSKPPLSLRNVNRRRRIQLPRFLTNRFTRQFTLRLGILDQPQCFMNPLFADRLPEIPLRYFLLVGVVVDLRNKA